MLNNLGFVFKTYLTVVNNFMQKNKQLEENKIWIKAIEKKKTGIKAESKIFANFAIT